MAIERISSKEGLVLPPQVPIDDIGLIALVGVDIGKATLETLDPGEYDLTPGVWTKNLHSHFLSVHHDGTGLYRAIPRDDEVGTVEPFGDNPTFEKGGRVIRLPQDQSALILAGPKANVAKIHLFELILHHD